MLKKKMWLPNSGFKKDIFSYWLKDWAQQRNLPYVNLFDPVVEWYRKKGNESLYQDPPHSHFNKKGLAWAAQRIEPEVIRLLNK